MKLHEITRNYTKHIDDANGIGSEEHRNSKGFNEGCGYKDAFLNIKPSEEPTFVEIIKKIGDRI